MKRLSFALLLSVGAVGSAWGQYPGQYPRTGSQPYPQPPNFGSRMPQSPLSPYLNLLNGTGQNPAANYYNLTRPFLQQQQGMSPFGQQFGPTAGAFQQQIGFLPPAPLPDYATVDPSDPTGGKLPQTGHQVGYGNRFSGTGSAIPRSTGFMPTGSQGQQTQQQTPRPSPPSKAIPKAKQ